MSGPDASPSPRPETPRLVGRPRSQLAIVAFVCGLAGVCPGVGLVGMVLGFIANLQIVRSGGRLRGRGYALWALGLGAGWTFIWMSLLSNFTEWYTGQITDRMESRIQQVITAGVAGDRAEVESLVDPGGDRASDAIERFVEDARESRIEVWTVSVGIPAGVDGVLDPVQQADVTMHAADRSVWSGTARFLVGPRDPENPSGIEEVLQVHLRRLHLIGPGGMALRLDPRAAPNSSTERESEVESKEPESQ